MLQYSFVETSYPLFAFTEYLARIFSITNSGHSPAFSTIFVIGAISESCRILTPIISSVGISSFMRVFSRFIIALRSATPPPGTTPSFVAFFTELKASSTRSFFSLSSASVAAPQEITPTPSVKRPRRSVNFFLRYSFFSFSI